MTSNNQQKIYARIIGSGSYLPDRIVTNDDLSKTLDTSDEWIRTRTGISQRHIAAENEYTSDLAAESLKDALNKTGVKASEIDVILLATATPDKTFPSAATIVQEKAGCKNAASMDINAACSGFVYALHIAKSLILSEQAKTIAVIGAETMSRVVDWNERSTCVLFGDGAGTVIIKRETASNGDNKNGIINTKIYSDGSYSSILGTDGGISETKTAGVLFMEGGEVFKHAVSKMYAVAKEVIEESELNVENIDWVVPHQANARILTSCVKKLSIPEEKLINTVQCHANTSSATIPLALDYAVSEGKIKPDDIVIMPALGAGLTWGCALAKWG